MSEPTITVEALPPFDMDWETQVPYLFKDLPILLEYLSGDTRTKVTSSGMVIENTMPTAYGYILGTTDAHGEEIDIYLANMPNLEAFVFIIDQIKPDTGLFDEHKVMLGFETIDEAKHTYLSVFADGSGEKRLGAITQFSYDQFKTWLTSESAAYKAAAYALEDTITEEVAGLKTPTNPKDQGPKPRDSGGGVFIDLPSLEKGPEIKTLTEDGNFHYHVYLFNALDVSYWSNLVDTFVRLCHLADDKDVFHLHIASPGGSVVLMGRIVSAINTTKARVITYAEGTVASAATAIWAAGHERHILPGAFFMQHMSSQLMMGKTTDIAAKSVFCMTYVEKQLQTLIDLGLFTQEEVMAMIEKSADVFISGRQAIARVGQISYRQ